MSARSRRDVLGLSGTALCLGLAGCTFDESAAETRLHHLGTANRDSVGRVVRVLMLEDGDPVYWDSMEVDGSSDSSYAPGDAFDGYPTDRGEFVLHAWRDDQPRSEWKTFDAREYDGSCASLLVQIGYERTGEVWLTRSTDC